MRLDVLGGRKLEGLALEGPNLVSRHIARNEASNKNVVVCSKKVGQRKGRVSGLTGRLVTFGGA